MVWPKWGSGGMINNPPDNRFEDQNFTTRVKKQEPEIVVFDNVTGAQTSDAYNVRKCFGFQVFTNGTISVTLQTGATQNGPWATLDTLTNTDFFSTLEFHNWIRLVAGSATNGYAYINFRRIAGI